MQWEESPPEPDTAGNLISDFQSPDEEEIRFVVYKLPSLWYFAIAA